MQARKPIGLTVLLALLVLCLFASCSPAKEPQDRLEAYLTALQNGDSKAMEACGIRSTGLFSDEIDSQLPESLQKAEKAMFRALYQQMRYEVVSFEKVSEEEFRFQVKCSAADLPALISELSDRLAERHTDLYLSWDEEPGKEEKQKITEADDLWIMETLTELLQQKNCKRTEQTVDIQVQLRKDRGWTVLADDKVYGAAWGCKANGLASNADQVLYRVHEQANTKLIEQGKKAIPDVLESFFSALKVYDITQVSKTVTDASCFVTTSDTQNDLQKAIFSRIVYRLQSVSGDDPFYLSARVKLSAVNLTAITPDCAENIVEFMMVALPEEWPISEINAELDRIITRQIKNPAAPMVFTEIFIPAVFTEDGWKLIPSHDLFDALAGGRLDQFNQDLVKELDRVFASFS